MLKVRTKTRNKNAENDDEGTIQNVLKSVGLFMLQGLRHVRVYWYRYGVKGCVGFSS